jgi:hypothetical protein
MFVENGVIPCVAAVHRAMEMTKAILETKGHTVVNFSMPEIPDLASRYMQILMSTHDYFDEVTKGEKRAWFATKPSLLPSSVMFKIGDWLGYERTVRIVRNSKVLNSQEFVEVYYTMLDDREKFISKWKELELDLII